jgi:cytochrome P450
VHKYIILNNIHPHTHSVHIEIANLNIALYIIEMILFITYLIEMTNSLITAQAFVFFLAGFETSSTTMSNALYELALNQLIQTKLRQEINDELKKCDGNLKYESIKNMKYMHKVFCGKII